jgi:hypothetical protein
MCPFRVYWSVAFVGFVVGIAPSVSADPAETTTAALREAVLRAGSSRQAAAAFRAYFLRLGRAKLNDQLKDENTGIALQAAWETHLKPVKRKMKAGDRTDDVYDPAELGRFVEFLKERTKAPVPNWWATDITDVDLFPGQHHGFIGPWYAARRKRKEADRGQLLVEMKEDSVICTAGNRSVEFPNDTFNGTFGGSFVGQLGEKRSVVAAYTSASGFAYQVAGFEGKGGKTTWKADVWAAGRNGLGGLGYHFVQMTEKDGVAYLFGMESHGAYVEAFDVATGRVQFRFCTCYWWNNSEAWGLK